MDARFHAVILAGGKGERFWPLSTEKRPKQLLSLLGEKTLLEEAVDRLSGLIPPERVLVITNRELQEAAREAAPSLPPENIIGEPVGRDTAAAVALGGAIVERRCPGGAFCVLTADHVIGDLDVFRRTLEQGLRLALEQDVLITIGIPPTEPSSSFGYIEAGTPYQERDGLAFLRVRRFVEKPDRARAEEYLATGRYYWNSGMFIWSAARLRQALARHCPKLAAGMAALRPAIDTPAFEAALDRVFADLEKISIDYALMEKADNIVTVQGLFRWDDVGSWPALEHHFPADASRNTIVGEGVALEAEDNLVVSRGRVTALLGVRDLIVVQADGATLICPKDRAQDIKKLVQRMRGDPRFEGVL